MLLQLTLVGWRHSYISAHLLFIFGIVERAKQKEEFSVLTSFDHQIVVQQLKERPLQRVYLFQGKFRKNLSKVMILKTIIIPNLQNHWLAYLRAKNHSRQDKLTPITKIKEHPCLEQKPLNVSQSYNRNLSLHLRNHQDVVAVVEEFVLGWISPELRRIVSHHSFVFVAVILIEDLHRFQKISTDVFFGFSWYLVLALQ